MECKCTMTETFMEVEMTLAFQESRTLSREDIEGNDDIEGGF